MSSTDSPRSRRVRPEEIEIYGENGETARVSEEYRDRVQNKAEDEWDGLSEEEIERWLSGTTASGDPVDEDEIDEVLYGGHDEFEPE